MVDTVQRYYVPIKSLIDPATVCHVSPRQYPSEDYHTVILESDHESLQTQLSESQARCRELEGLLEEILESAIIPGTGIKAEWLAKKIQKALPQTSEQPTEDGNGQ